MEAWQIVCAVVGSVAGLFFGIWGITHRQTLLLREDIKTAKEDLAQRMDRSEAANQAEHAALSKQVGEQGKSLSDVREKVGELSGLSDQALVNALRRLMGKKESGGPPDSD